MSKPDQTARLTRLMRLCAEVKSNPSTPPKVLYRTLGVSETQYHKDREALKAIGFTYHWDRREERHVIDTDLFLPVLNLELTELISLAMAVRQLSATGDHTLTYGAIGALKKLGSQAGTDLQPVIDATIEGMVLHEGFGCDADILSVIHTAIDRRQTVGVRYVGPATNWKPVESEIDPYLLFFRRRALYLDGRCRDSGKIRTWRVNRVQTATPVAKYFTIHNDYDPHTRHRESWEVFSGGEPRIVTVRFSPRVAHYIEESPFHSSQQIEWQDDGSLLFEVTVSEPREVAWWVMRWGADAEILEPEDLREWVKEEVAKMGRMYGDG